MCCDVDKDSKHILGGQQVLLPLYNKRVVSIVCFLLGDSPESEVYMPMFWNTVCSIFIGAYWQNVLKRRCINFTPSLLINVIYIWSSL
jgi:hypothetical protein